MIVQSSMTIKTAVAASMFGAAFALAGVGGAGAAQAAEPAPATAPDTTTDLAPDSDGISVAGFDIAKDNTYNPLLSDLVMGEKLGKAGL